MKINKNDKNMEKNQVIKEITNTSNIIRKKYNALKRGKMDFEENITRTLKPVVVPLQEIAKQIKSDNKNNEEKILDEQATIIEKKQSNISEIASTSTPKKIKKDKRIISVGEQPPSLLQNMENTEENINDEEIYESPTLLETSIQEVVSNPNKLNALDKYLDENVGPTLKAYMLEFFKDNNKIIDKTYGPHYEENVLMLGCKTFDVRNDDYIVIGDKYYKATPGLLELIFKKNPNAILFKSTDLKNYTEILEYTKVYRKSYTNWGQIKSNKGNKYKNIISKLINKTGRGLNKINNKKKVLKSINMNVFYKNRI